MSEKRTVRIKFVRPKFGHAKSLQKLTYNTQILKSAHDTDTLRLYR